MHKAKFNVYLNTTGSKVHVLLDGFGSTTTYGLEEIGSFDLGVDENTKQIAEGVGLTKDGEHILIHKGREVLKEHLGEGANVDKYTFYDEASQHIPEINYDDGRDLSTDALPATEPNSDPDASAQAGGETSEGPTPAMQATTGLTSNEPKGDKTGTPDEEGTDPVDDDTSKKETVAALKERIAKINDKAELQKEYDAEVNGQNRPTAVKAIEDRAAELGASE